MQTQKITVAQSVQSVGLYPEMVLANILKSGESLTEEKRRSAVAALTLQSFYLHWSAEYLRGTAKLKPLMEKIELNNGALILEGRLRKIYEVVKPDDVGAVFGSYGQELETQFMLADGPKSSKKLMELLIKKYQPSDK